MTKNQLKEYCEAEFLWFYIKVGRIETACEHS